MTVPRNEPVGLRPSAEAEAFQRLFQSLSNTLLGVLTEKYLLSEEDAIVLLQDAFYAFTQLTVPTSEAEEWLTASICLSAAKISRRRKEAVDEDIAEIREMLDRQRAFQVLPAQARRAVRLRVHEERSFEEIAEELNVTVDAARRLVRTSVEKLRRLHNPEKP